MHGLVDVIRIPCGGDRLKVKRIPWTLLSAQVLESAPEESWDLEYYLKHVPDLMGLTTYSKWSGSKDWRSYAWQSRSLVSLGNMDPDQTPDDLQESRGPFFMYACYNASPDWDLNQHFWRLPVDPPLPQVYGDAFIFKVKERPFDKFGKVRYDNLNEETIQSAFNGNGMGSDECLTWLAKQERNWRDLSRLYT